MNAVQCGPKRHVLLTVCLLLFLSLAASASPRTGSPIPFCVHPYLPASEIRERFTPLVSYLSRALGIPVELEIARDYQNHISRFGKQRRCFCFLGPASYVKLVDTAGTQRLLGKLEKAGKPYFRGVIFVAEQSPVKRLSDLAGKKFAFGDPESTLSTLVPQYLLSKTGITPDKLAQYSFLRNHDNIVLAVLMGDFDAGAVMEDVFDEYKHRGLRAIAKTPEIPEHVFLAGTGVSPALAARAGYILRNMKNSEQGRKALHSIKTSVTGVAPARDSDYDALRRIILKVKKNGGGF